MMKALKQARTAISMLKADEVRKRSERQLHLGLVASTERSYGEMERVLESRQGLHRASDFDVPKDVDLVFYERGIPHEDEACTLDPVNPTALVDEVMKQHEDLALPLARQFPGLRRPVVDRIVQAIARENALFALATALPNVVPNLIELPWAFGEFASDTAFLTANQVRMAFLVAGACGREIGFAHQKTEIISIVAGAFGWRALARELAGKIPLGGGLIPKGAIAYAGTYAVGKGLEYYHHVNRHFTPEESEQVYREAFEKGRQVAESAVNPR
jgi:uncharacterized protein (DUF697 family)